MSKMKANIDENLIKMSDLKSNSSDEREKDANYWKSKLTPEQYQVTREGGTERAFTGAYWSTKKTGTYYCICCNAPLFISIHKFDSGTGWPSFYESINSNAIRTRSDTSHRMMRTEIICSKCNSHLGHLFNDGPQPTGQRFCVNSLSLKFLETES